MSKRWLALGSSGGGLNLIQKDGWKQRLFLTHKVRMKNSIQEFPGKMCLGKRPCLKLFIFIEESPGISSLLNCPNKVKFQTGHFKKGCSAGV